MLDGDIAQTLGAILREELLVESEILAIDGVMLRDFDYIDLGRIRMPSYTVPVTIKSLVFSANPTAPKPQRIHHHDHAHDHAHDHSHGHSHGSGHHDHGHDHAHAHDHNHDHHDHPHGAGGRRDG
jgi:ethanolamine utilization protein EutA